MKSRTNKYIKIFATGGTFDKEFNEIDGSLYFKETNLFKLLDLGRSNVEVSIETLMMVDSLDMTNAERQYILDKCNYEKSNKIIITHGTDTMVQTAAFLAKGIKEKVVILTGAMIPIKFGSSDGLFNLGSALSFAQTLKPGVYITMNGQYFTWDNVQKNKKIGIFERVKSS